jgi:hypothetical protein
METLKLNLKIISSIIVFLFPIQSVLAVMPCTSPTLNTGTTTITPSTTWQTVTMASGAVRYVEFVATLGTTYVFSCQSAVGGSSSSDEQFSLLTTSNVGDGGVFSTNNVNAYTSGTKERFIWSPSSTATYRFVVSIKASGSDCQALTSNIIVGYSSFVGTQNFAFWTGFSSTTFGTAANWFRRATTGYPTESAPTSSYNVFIPAGGTNQPNCGNTSSSILGLTIYSGATLNMSYSSGSLSVYGDITNNGSINHSGTVYIYLYGASKTIGGTGDFFAGSASPFRVSSGASYTLLNDISVRHFYIDAGTFDMNDFNLTTEFFFQNGTFYLGSATLRIWGNHDASMWSNPGDGINPYFTTSGNFYPETGTVFYCQGDTYTANDQKIRTTTYYNLKVNTQSGKTATLGTASTITVTNDFTIQNSSTAGGVATSAADITVGNNLYIGSSGNALTLNLPYRLYRSSGTGTLTMGNNTSHAINITYASASNFCISGFGASPTFYGTLTYNSGSAQKVITATYYNLTSTGSGTKTLYGNIVVNNNVSFTGGNFVQDSYNMNIAGNWSSTGSYYTEGTGNVTFDGTGASTITAVSSAISGSPNTSMFTQSFENGGAIPSGWGTTIITDLGTDPACTFVPSSTYPSGFTPSNGSYMVKFNSYSCLSGSQIRLNQTSSTSSVGYTNIRVSFDWTTDNGYSSSADNVQLLYSTNGSTWTNVGSTINRYAASNEWTTQSLTLPSGAENQATLYIGFLFTSGYGNNCYLDNMSVVGDLNMVNYDGELFNKFITNKTGGGSVTLGGNILIQTDLTFTAGVITTTNNYHVELHENATLTNTPTNTCHINGYIKKNKNTTAKFTFPCGDGSYYRPLAITPAGTGATIWTCKYFTNGHADQTVLDIDHVSEVEYWTLDRAGASPENATIELSWNENSFVDEDYLDLVVAHYNGTDWHDAGNNNIVGDANNGVLESDVNWSDYSPFTLGSIIGNVPLPVTLVDFDAKPYLNNVKTSWTSSSEINNDFFTVERSPNGVDFTFAGRVEGAGNSDYEINYTLIDKNFDSGINYYRLKQTDFDGKETFSPIVSVDIEKDVRVLLIKVNSLGQEVNSNYKGIVFDIYSDGSSTKRIQ